MAAETHSEGENCSLETGNFEHDRVYEWLEDYFERNDLDVTGNLYDPYTFGHMSTDIEKKLPEWPMVQVRTGTLTLYMHK